jgi:hypothetical protein
MRLRTWRMLSLTIRGVGYVREGRPDAKTFKPKAGGDPMAEGNIGTVALEEKDRYA